MRLLFTISLVVFLPSAAVAEDRPGAWLDLAPVQWNQPGVSLPNPPQDVMRSARPDYCRTRKPSVNSPEERAVAGAGWIAIISYRGSAGITVVVGAASEDGMCRPDPYQDFVFVNGEFAGTLSPRVMGARADGSVNRVGLPGGPNVIPSRRRPGNIMAYFSRYTEADPLCCPSRISEATYEIRESSGKPVLVLVSVRTRPT